MTSPVLLAVAHGTRNPADLKPVDNLVERVRQLAPHLRVDLAYVDHAVPSVSTALASLAALDVPTAVVPLLLSAGTHSKTDIPGAIQRARAAHPGWRVTYGRPLGPHPLLIAAIDRLLSEAGAGRKTAVVLLAAGSADPDANSDVAKLARLVWEWRGGGPVEAAFATATTPTVQEAIGRLRRLGHDDIAVVPYFLSPGLLPTSAEQPGVTVAGPLGDSEEVARLLLERYAEAVTGDLRMNCDVCRYRTPWPGRESAVGAAPLPHRHPADG